MLNKLFLPLKTVIAVNTNHEALMLGSPPKGSYFIWAPKDLMVDGGVNRPPIDAWNPFSSSPPPRAPRSLLLRTSQDLRPHGAPDPTERPLDSQLSHGPAPTGQPYGPQPAPAPSHHPSHRPDEDQPRGERLH